jgi:predicted AlkP superfamily pyrophosphatase or phosphodiesterase
MKRIAAAILALSFALAAFATHPDRHVVVFSIDGFPAWLWHRPDLPVPNLRKLAAEGAAADHMVVTTPASTWSSHTSMITSRSPRYHGVFFNAQVFRRGPGRPLVIEQWVDKDGFVLVPTLYDIAHDAGLTTAESDWVAITRAKTIDWSFPEIPSVDGKVERELIAAGRLTPEQVGWMQHDQGRKSLVWHDQMWVDAACYIFARHRPNLLLIHPLTTDSINHHVGPGTEASYVAFAYADRLVGQVVAAVEQAGLRDQTTFIIMTDHGFKKVSRQINGNIALRDAGLLRFADGKVVAGQAMMLSLGGSAFVYVTDPAQRAALLPELKALFEKMEGIARVLDGAEGPTLGLPTPAENDRVGDLILIAKDGYFFNDQGEPAAVVTPADGYGGTHGYPGSDPDMAGIFIASGAHIKKGVTLPAVSNLDLAPTIARILDLPPLPKAEGRVLDEILQ